MKITSLTHKLEHHGYQYGVRTLLVVLLLIVVGPAWARKWTDNSGTFSIEAELVEIRDGSVRLKRLDGRVITVPIAGLSKVDRNYLASIAKAKEKPETPQPTRDEAIAAIKELQGLVELDHSGAVVTVRLAGSWVTDAATEHLTRFTQLYTLELTGTQVTDEGKEKLCQALPRLRR